MATEFSFNPSTGETSGKGYGLGDLFHDVIGSNTQLGVANLGYQQAVDTNWLDNWVKSQGLNLGYISNRENNALQDLLSSRNTALQDLISGRQNDTQRYLGDLGLQGTRLQTDASRYGADQSRLGQIGAATASAEPGRMRETRLGSQFDRVWGKMADPLVGLLTGNGYAESIPGTYGTAQAQAAAAPVAAQAAAAPPPPQNVVAAPAYPNNPVASPAYPTAPGGGVVGSRPGPGQVPYSPQRNDPNYDAKVAALAPRRAGQAATPTSNVPPVSAPRGSVSTPPGGMHYASAQGTARWSTTKSRAQRERDAAAKPAPAAPPPPVVAAPAPAPAPAPTPAPVQAQNTGPAYGLPPSPNANVINPLQQRGMLNQANAQVDRAAQGAIYRDMPNQYAASGFAPTGRGLAADQGLANYRAAQMKSNNAFQIPMQVGQYNNKVLGENYDRRAKASNDYLNRQLDYSKTRMGLGGSLLGNLLSG